ncbi:hypothetical protein BDV3_006615 [Batrachochytrium dendrobatidis]
MTRIYVKYLENTPVSLFTQKLPVPEGEEPNISDLVAAVKQALPSKLGAIDPDELTIHYAVDGPAIAGNTLLASIQEPVGSYNQPLVIKAKSGTGQGISSSVPGAPVGSNTGMVSGTFEETADTETTVSLLKYHHIADSLKDDDCVVKIVKIILAVTAGEFSGSSFKNLPFAFLEGSSGSGKSQMGFNIKANIGDRRRVHYLLFDPPGSTSQRIYRNFENISKLFSKCYVEDEHMYTSETSSPSCGSLFKESLYMYGFIFELLSNRIQSPTVSIGPKTGKDVQELMTSKGIHQHRPVFILDECIAISDQSLKKVRFVRNCFRSLGLGLVMMGTDSRAAKLQLSIGGSSRSDVPMPWCHVFGEFPAVKLELTGLPQTLPRYLKSIILNSRPLFAQLVAEEIANNASDFDELMKAAFIKLKSVKKIFGNLYGQLGQVRLFHNAHCQLTDLESQSTNLKNQSTPLIHSHFAQLDGKKTFILMNDGCIQDHSASWEPSSVFPELKNDILLYLLLMGGKGFSACYAGDGKQVPYAHFLMKAKSNPDYRSHILYFSNAAQDSNDGMFLESLLCSTVCLASHSNGVKGIGLKPFLLNLSSKLGRIPEAAKVELVFTRKLQDSYFNPPAPSFEIQFQRKGHVLKKAYYKIDASKPNTLLEPIKGLPCDQPDMDGVVIFFEINDKLII